MERFSRTLCVTILFAFLSPIAVADPSGDCEGTPEDAVVDVPMKMAAWAQIICTPYGHILAAKDGWVWSYPGTFNPVMIPSQMVQKSPKAVGSDSYFSEIEFEPATDDESVTALSALNDGYDSDNGESFVYRLVVRNQNGGSLRLLFDVPTNGDDIWGIWCADECSADLSFMVLKIGTE